MTELNIDSSYGVIIVQDMKAVHVDDNYARIYGYRTPQELLSSIDSFLDLIDPSWHDIARQNYNEIISGQAVPRGHTFKNVDPHGREFTVFTIDHLIEWQGKPALQVTVMDLTMVEEANRRLRENDLKYKRLITRSGQGILVHRNFKPLMVNESWVKMMRAESIEAVMSKESVLDIVEPESRQTAIERNQSKLSGETVESESNVFANICYDGTKRYFNVYDNLIEWDNEPAIQVVLEDVTEKVMLEKELAYKASHDQLTDLLNRFAVYEWLKEQQASAETMSCMLMDIDDFKKINDTHGHMAGDNVIGTFASIIKSIVEGKGVAGRWGGEEFIVFLPDASESDSRKLAEKLCKSFNDIVFENSDSQFSVSVSVGFSYSDGSYSADNKGKSIDSLIRDADDRLYQAKSEGKNRVVG